MASFQDTMASFQDTHGLVSGHDGLVSGHTNLCDFDQKTIVKIDFFDFGTFS